ncbi:MAG: c-type cytochrome [Gammaproteobacteria bacterium]
MIGKLLPMLLAALPAVGGEISTDRQQTLRDLLKRDCGACHGLTLKGGMGPALLPENLAGKSDDFLADTILNGRKGTAMPPWKPFMNREEALWLVAALRKGAYRAPDSTHP